MRNTNRRQMLKASMGVATLPLLPSVIASNNPKDFKAPRRLVYMSIGFGMSTTFYKELGTGENFFNKTTAPLKNM